MNLDEIWDEFLKQLSLIPHFLSIQKQLFSGIPFLYITVTNLIIIDEQFIEDKINQIAIQCMKGKRLFSETKFVRREAHIFVYRHRFFVPQEKMFCCGNQCVNCVRLKNKKP